MPAARGPPADLAVSWSAASCCVSGEGEAGGGAARQRRPAGGQVPTLRLRSGLGGPARSPATCTSPAKARLELGRAAPPPRATHNPWEGWVRAQQHWQQLLKTARPSRRSDQHPLPTGAYSLSERCGSTSRMLEACPDVRDRDSDSLGAPPNLGALPCTQVIGVTSSPGPRPAQTPCHAILVTCV